MSCEIYAIALRLLSILHISLKIDHISSVKSLLRASNLQGQNKPSGGLNFAHDPNLGITILEAVMFKINMNS